MNVTVTIEDGAFQAAMGRWLEAAHSEGVDANLEVAKDIQASARALVHKRTGRLMEAIDASHDGDDALVGPTGAAASKNGPYGRFIELGGVHKAHNPSGYMWWVEGGALRRARVLVKSGHPYLKPAAEEIISGGDAKRIYYDAWLKAQESV